MHAIVEIKGKQYKVSPDQTVYIDLTGQEPGSEISIDKVLLIQNGADVKVGTPYVPNAVVKAKIVSEVKAPKINGFIYRRKKRSQRRWGHRQKFQHVQIVSING